jgi:hypothetical protein
VKFWKRLRWIISALFVAVLLLSWLATDSNQGKTKTSNSELREAPTFNH